MDNLSLFIAGVLFGGLLILLIINKFRPQPQPIKPVYPLADTQSEALATVVIGCWDGLTQSQHFGKAYIYGVAVGDKRPADWVKDLVRKENRG